MQANAHVARFCEFCYVSRMRMLPDAELSNGTLPINKPKAFGCDRSRDTVRRWCLTGVESRVTGEIIQLECAYEGPTLVTTRAAYLRFLRALNNIPEEAVQ